MRTHRLTSLLLVGLSAVAMAQRPAENLPIVQTKYTADPAPMVVGDTVYLYTTHDEDDAEGFKMRDWLLYTSTDMVNWQDHGAVASLKDFPWFSGDNGAWALQVVKRGDKYYMYCPIHGHGIGVLVADSPYGPWTDPLGKPLVWQREHWYDIDPTVWIDDDNQAYLYWGNPNLYCAKLNDDMISLASEITTMPHIDDYQEGPWFYKHDGRYYVAFASTCCPEGIGYAMSDGPMGPWTYKGHIMDHTPRTRGNHPGIIDFKGRSYVFGLNYDILHLETPRHAERRSVWAADMHYNADGTIEQLPYSQDCTLTQVGTFNPFRHVEAETMAWGYGLKTTPLASGHPTNQAVVNIDEGEFIMLRGVDFGRGATKLTVSAACAMTGGSIEVRLDRADGPLAGTVKISNTGDQYRTFATQLRGAKGKHDLYFVFRGNAFQKHNLFTLDWWEMSR